MPSGKAPPRIPNEDELEEAYGLASKAKRVGVLRLSMYEREAIVRILGRVPENKTEAARWRIYLRALRKQVAQEPDLDDAEGAA